MAEYFTLDTVRNELLIFIKDPNIGLTIIEIIYARETHNGYIRANNMKLRQLIEKSLIDEDSLEKVSFVM